jgi:hypothetical protein
MWTKIQERIFPFIIALSALSVSASAAFYSISGLSKLFAGAAFAVIVMAASLEVAKLVIASLLYQYRKVLPKLLKIYLSIACFILILITSMGIYGFLSAAYQETSAKAGSIDSQIALIETKRDNVREQLTVYNAEKSTINGALSNLRAGLSNNKIQYTNAEGVLITTTSSSTRRALEKQLDQAIDRQTTINSRVDDLNTKLFEYETEIVEVSTNNDIAGELGPLKYLSGLTGIPMDQIINYLLLTIIFVFDPLAIALVIAANFAFARLRPKTKENLYGEKVIVEEKNPWDEFEEELPEDNEESHSDHLYEEPNLSKIKESVEEFDWDAAESRMNVIGQNGNDGEHYEEEVEMALEDDIKEPLNIKELEDNIKSSPVSSWRISKELKELEKLKSKKDNDDLTIKY